MQSGAGVAVSLVILHETHTPTLLSRKAARLRKETGNQALYSPLDSTKMTTADKLRISIKRPSKMLVTVPTIILASLYVAVCYGCLYLFFTTFTFVFESQYGFSEGDVGLTYIASGIGMIGGVLTYGALADRFIGARIRKGETLKPEYRLNPYMTISGGLLMPAGLFIYGWTVDYKTHWVVPLFGTAVFGFGMMGIMVSSGNCYDT